MVGQMGSEPQNHKLRRLLEPTAKIENPRMSMYPSHLRITRIIAFLSDRTLNHFSQSIGNFFAHHSIFLLIEKQKILRTCLANSVYYTFLFGAFIFP